MRVTVERRRWAGQSGQRLPGRPDPDADHVIDQLARLLGSRSPRAARQALRRAETVLRAWADACHQCNAPHRLVRLHALSRPVPLEGGLDRAAWMQHGQVDRLEDSARESLELGPDDADDLRHYRATLAREVAEKMALLARIDRQLEGA